jgi:uncharacterized protein (TIGR03086 family)
MLDPVAAHQRAQDVFAGVLAKVAPHQLADPTPCEQWTVRELIGHVIRGNELVAIRAGLRSEDDARGGDFAAAHRVSAAEAQRVFGGADGMTRTFELPAGPIPGSTFIWIRTSDALVHAWDLAKATGQPTDLDPELAGYLLASSGRHLADSLRGRVYGYPQPCDEGRPPAHRLAAFLGRAVG